MTHGLAVVGVVLYLLLWRRSDGLPGVQARQLLQAPAGAPAPAPTPALSLPSGCAPVTLTQSQTKVVNAMNAVRSIYGRPQLALDPVLMCAAQSAAADATLAQVCSPVLDTLGLANATVRGRVVLCQAALDGCTLGPIDPTEVVQLTSCGAASAGAVVRDWLRLDVGWNETGVASPVFRRLGVANNQADPTIFWAATLSP